MSIDSYDIFIIICLIICVSLFFVHLSNTYNVLKQSTYAMDCNGLFKDIEYYSLRNRIYRYGLFDNTYKKVFSIISIIIIILMFIIRIILLRFSKQKDIILFSFVLLFMIFHIIIFKNKGNVNTYKQYELDIENLKDKYKEWLIDYAQKEKTKDEDKRYQYNSKRFKQMIKENIDTVMKGTVSSENLEETFIKNNSFINFIDFSDPRSDITNDIRIELYKNTYKILPKLGNYHYEMLRDLYKFHYGPDIYKGGIYLNFFNWLFSILAITILLLYIHNIIYA